MHERGQPREHDVRGQSEPRSLPCWVLLAHSRRQRLLQCQRCQRHGQLFRAAAVRRCADSRSAVCGRCGRARCPARAPRVIVSTCVCEECHACRACVSACIPDMRVCVQACPPACVPACVDACLPICFALVRVRDPSNPHSSIHSSAHPPIEISIPSSKTDIHPSLHSSFRPLLALPASCRVAMVTRCELRVQLRRQRLPRWPTVLLRSPPCLLRRATCRAAWASSVAGLCKLHSHMLPTRGVCVQRTILRVA